MTPEEYREVMEVINENRSLRREIESLKISNRWLSEESAGFEKRWKAAQEHAAKLEAQIEELTVNRKTA